MTSAFDRLIIMQRLFDTLSRDPGGGGLTFENYDMNRWKGREEIATLVRDLTNGRLGLLGCEEFW